MDVYQAVSTLSSIRNFINKKASDEIINKILEAGRLAPSAHNDQPWEFVLIKDKAKLKEMGSYCISGSFITQSDFAIVVLTDPGSKWQEIDTTRAAQNMILTAWSFEIGTCWVGRIEEGGLKNYLKIPKGKRILTVLPFGYFDKRLIAKNKFRKRASEVFHLNEYGYSLK
ncbi:MAG: hypothetical protein GTO02_00355 [Candidatus Dadabacteria bacterium]|nr:hypothetical protein [Candidatus Dadabacteria bacterium]